MLQSSLKILTPVHVLERLLIYSQKNVSLLHPLKIRAKSVTLSTINGISENHQFQFIKPNGEKGVVELTYDSVG